MDLLIGGLAHVVAANISNPLDILRTRIQLQGELRHKGQYPVHYGNIFQSFKVVITHDGIRGLQKGLGVAVILHGVRSSILLGLYQICYNNGMLSDDNECRVLWKVCTCSALCGAMGAFATSPLCMVKTQLQSQTNKEVAVGYQHGHTSTVQALKHIYCKHGIIGLWRGADSAMLRAFASSTSKLTSFLMMKDVLERFEKFHDRPVATAFIASLFSGVFQTIIITPLDIISVRIYNQGVTTNGKGLLYSGISDCFTKIWRIEGFLSFYKGVIANYMRVAPHSAVTLVFWDIYKDIHVKPVNVH